MKRRQFLSHTGILATGMGISAHTVAQNFDCYVQRLPGAQLYTIREALAVDPEAVLQALAATGIREVELYGLTGEDSIFGMPLLSFRTLLDRYNLSMTCTHVFPENIEVLITLTFNTSKPVCKNSGYRYSDSDYCARLYPIWCRRDAHPGPTNQRGNG